MQTIESIQTNWAWNKKLLFIPILFFISCTNEADLIILNANIWTGNEVQPHTEAMAIKDDLIIAIGTNKEISQYVSDAKTIDANQRFINPGFIDCHVHLLTGGRSLLSVELRDADKPEEFIKRIREFAEP